MTQEQWQHKVEAEYLNVGYNLTTEGKRAVMQSLAFRFHKRDMNRVYWFLEHLHLDNWSTVRHGQKEAAVRL